MRRGGKGGKGGVRMEVGEYEKEATILELFSESSHDARIFLCAHTSLAMQFLQFC